MKISNALGIDRLRISCESGSTVPFDLLLERHSDESKSDRPGNI